MPDTPKPPCSLCGQPYHRYSPEDPEHDADPVACVNSLWAALDARDAELEREKVRAKLEHFAVCERLEAAADGIAMRLLKRETARLNAELADAVRLLDEQRTLSHVIVPCDCEVCAFISLYPPTPAPQTEEET